MSFRRGLSVALLVAACGDDTVTMPDAPVTTSVTPWSRGFTVDWLYHELAADPDGNVYLTGAFDERSVTFGGGTFTAVGANDMFIAGFGPDGAHAFSQQRGGTAGNVYPQGIDASASGEVVIAGGFAGDLGDLSNPGTDLDLFVTRMTSTGAQSWSRAYGGDAAESAFGVAIAPDGAVIAGGVLNGSTTFGTELLTSAGSADALVLGLDGATGDITWARRFGGVGEDTVRSLAVGADGSIYIAGWFEGTVQLDTFTLTADGGSDFFVARLDPSSHAVTWARGIGSATIDKESPIMIDALADGVAVLGNPNGTANLGGTPLSGGDVFVAVYEAADGAFRWARQQDAIEAIAAGSNGRVWMTGAAAAGDVIAVELGDSGAVETTLTYPGTATLRSRRVASVGDGTIAISGALKGSGDFGSGRLVDSAATMGGDLFIAVLSR